MGLRGQEQLENTADNPKESLTDCLCWGQIHTHTHNTRIQTALNIRTEDEEIERACAKLRNASGRTTNQSLQP